MPRALPLLLPPIVAGSRLSKRRRPKRIWRFRERRRTSTLRMSDAGNLTWCQIGLKFLGAIRGRRAFRANVCSLGCQLIVCFCYLNALVYVVQEHRAAEENEWGDLDNQSCTSSRCGTRKICTFGTLLKLFYPFSNTMIYLRLLVFSLGKVMGWYQSWRLIGLSWRTNKVLSNLCHLIVSFSMKKFEKFHLTLFL